MKMRFFYISSLVSLFVLFSNIQHLSGQSVAKTSSNSAIVNVEHFSFEKRNDDSCVEVTLSVDLPKADNAALAKIRKSVLSLINENGNSPKECFDNDANNFIHENAIPKEDLFEWAGYSTSEDSIYVDAVTPYFIQFCRYSYVYFTGAAHGFWGFSYYIFDFNTGELLTENDLFTNLDKIGELLKTEGYDSYVKDNYSQNMDEVDIWKEGIGTNGNFAVKGDKLIYQFNPYEIAPYSAGAPTFELDKESVKPYLKTGTVIYKYWFGE